MVFPPDYDVGPHLGRGSTAEVYEATHRSSGTPVALKVVRPVDRRMQRALEVETLAQARLNHPHVLVLHDVGTLPHEDGVDRVWLAMELARGGTYSGWNPSTWEEVEPVLEAVMTGLAHAHARGVVHRDLKPANLLRAREDDVRPGPKIADFGLTTVRDAQTVYRRGGTPRYMPPEQVDPDRGRVGPWSDLYALGCTLWEWLCGRAPFDGPPAMVMHRQVHSVVPDFQPRFPVPSSLTEALHGLLEKRPGDRPASVGAFRRALGWVPPGVMETIGSIPSNTASLRAPGLGQALIPLRTPNTVGRHGERALLVSELQRVIDRKASTIRLLQGSDGSGRHHLIRWLAESANEAGLVETFWDPADLGDLLPVAAKSPVVVAFTTLDDHVEGLLASMAFVDAPILALAPCHRRSDWPDLLVLRAAEAIDIDPMNDPDVAQILHIELGMAGDPALRMAARCGGSPGLALGWLRSLALRQVLLSRDDGFDTVDLGDPPKADHHDLDGVLASMNESSRRSLSAAAWCGREVPRGLWTRVAAGLGTTPDDADLGELLRHEMVRVDGERLVLRADGLAARLRQSVDPTEATELADALAEGDSTPVVHWVRGQLYLHGGHLNLARHHLLRVRNETGFDPRSEHLQRRGVELLRHHMNGASPDDQLHFALQDTRTTLNLNTSHAAQPKAVALEKLVQACPDADPELRRRCLVMVALIYAFQEMSHEALRVLDTLPEDPQALRARGLVLNDMGRFDEALEVLEKSLAMQHEPSGRARVLNGLGSIYGRLGNHELAADFFARAAHGLHPKLRDVPLGNLAMTKLLAGQPQEALAAARSAFYVVRTQGAARATSTCILLAIAAALTDDPELDNVRAQALYSQRRWGLPEAELLRPVVQAAHPRRAQSIAFCEALLHAM